MSATATPMSEVSPAATDSVTESVPTIAQLIAAYSSSDHAWQARQAAVIVDESLFVASAILTFTAVRGGVTGKSIADAANDAKVGYQSESAVSRHAWTGEVLSLPGDLSEGISARDIQACYSKKGNVNGSQKTISVTAKQHKAIVAKAIDVAHAYKLLVAQFRANHAELKKLAEVPAVVDTDDDSVTESAPTADAATVGKVDSVTESLRIALAALTAIIGRELSDTDYGLLAQVSETVNLLADDGAVTVLNDGAVTDFTMVA